MRLESRALGSGEAQLIDLPKPALSLQKREQVGVDDVGLRRDHAVRKVFICFQPPVLTANKKGARQSERPREIFGLELYQVTLACRASLTCSDADAARSRPP